VERALAAGASKPPAVADGIVLRRALFERLQRAGRVVAISAPAGSGKTLLVRSWICEAGLADAAAWVSVRHKERDPQRFWISVVDALHGTATPVRGLTAAPSLDGGAIVERLLEDLASLEDRVWLVIDDLHELHSPEALSQLELLLMRAPAALRFVVSSRHDLGLGLHRLRLEAELTEIRAADLRFTLDEACALLDAAGLELSDTAPALLHGRTEGWAAGLRLAALSLAGHPDPESLAAEFSGSDRTVADYLVAEVLDRQPEEVKQLLLRTSVLDRISGPLADALTEGSGAERILQELEEANAFVVSLDARRTWFRCHNLFADLLQLALRRTAPDDVTALHAVAAEWYAEHGYVVEAIRHAQAAEQWSMARGLLFEHWVGLVLDGQSATAHGLLRAFPPRAVAGDAELTALAAADALVHGSPHEVERRLTLATRRTASLPADRRTRFEVFLAVVRLALARRRGDQAAVEEEAGRLLAPADAAEALQLEFGDDLRAWALINLGIAELSSSRLDDAERHVDEGTDLAHRIERPYLEMTGLAHGTLLLIHRSSELAVQRGLQAVELAERHGWADDPAVGVAYAMLGGAMLARGRLAEAARWLGRAERALRVEDVPAANLALHDARGLLELASGRYEEALLSFRRAERLSACVVPGAPAVVRSHTLQTLVMMGNLDRAAAVLADLDDHDREAMVIPVAMLRLARHDPHAATVALAPVLGGSAPFTGWMVEAFLLEAIARDALCDAGAAASALERALDLAEPDSILYPFLLHPAPGHLERHRGRTAHAGLTSQLLDLLAGAEPSARRAPVRLREPLTKSELRVLRYLPTNLTQPEIAAELYLSVNTVNTHIRHLYTKLGTHRRGEAVERARALGLLAPSARRS
jgi:LuxR family transcriptional regulator, maltose regulon positive regulatory protein